VVLKFWKQFPYFGIKKKKLHLKNENVEFVPIVIEPHCKYSAKKHSSWVYCLTIYFDDYFP
jgi:hypothetical protein